jgi:hypothetical protein
MLPLEQSIITILSTITITAVIIITITMTKMNFFLKHFFLVQNKD